MRTSCVSTSFIYNQLLNQMNMKTKLLVFLSISFLSVFSLSAQVKLGVEAGMNVSHYLGGDKYCKEKGGMKSGFQVGLTADYEMKNNWMLMSGLSLLQSRSTIAMNGGYLNFPEADVKINNLILPVRVGYHIHINKNLSFIPSIGVYGAYAFSAGSCDMTVIHPKEGADPERVEWKPMSGYNYFGRYYSSEKNIDTSIDKYKHWDFGGMVGLKAVIYRNYTASFNYSAGMKKVFLNKLHNSYYQLSVGYQF